MALLSLIPLVGDILDKLTIDPDKKAEMKLELAKLADQELARASNERIAQTEVNKVEATHRSIFVAGWRPAVGWGCAAAFVYTTILAPLFGLHVADLDFVRDILLGMLGISVGARTVEKVKGVAEDTIGTPKVTPIATPAPRKKKPLGGLWPF